ncbi:MAG: phosphoribosyltransferase family protein, partial [[Clostridium] symbiosum]
VVMGDDLIATGGTTGAVIRLFEIRGGEVVKICVVMELAGLHGRDREEEYPVDSLITYEGK